MDRLEIFAVLDQHVFATEKAYLIRNIAENPERFVGVFRSTTPRLKLIQNLLQSREIRFGDALEIVMRKLIESLGFENLPRAITMPDGKALDFDQYFTTPSRNTYYLVEQKVRDDHDSSKKRGQVGNFKQKLEYLKLRHGESLVGVMYFIDPSLTKNIGYYKPELETISRELNISIYLFYNGEFFEHLTGDSAAWGILASALLAWRDSVPTDIDLNCDLPKDLDEILSVEPTVWYKLVSNEQLWTSGVVKCVFPEGTNLVKVSSKLAQTGSYTLWAGRRKIPYRELATLIQNRVSRHYSIQYDLPGDEQTPLL